MASTLPTGSDHCQDEYFGTLCGYKAIFECDYWSTLHEKIAEACLVLRKDCPEGCTYTSRWAETDYDNIRGIEIDAREDRPRL